MQLINIGFGSMISTDKIIAVVSPESLPIKRLIQEARENKKIIDVTFGRKTRAAIIMDSGHIVLSAVQTETVAQRNEKNNN